jgi:prolyl-tRNA synthetase
MPDGKSLQIGTIHHLGTNFAKTFDITYEDLHGDQQFVNQTCYGISERCIAAVISVHGDEKGLVLPPEVAPVQLVIVPIFSQQDDNDAILNACEELKEELSHYRVVIDADNVRPGAKFYKWERQGVPIRLEIGPKDLANSSVTLVRRDTGKKERVKRSELQARLAQELTNFLQNIAEKAREFLISNTLDIELPEQAKGRKGMFQISWCGSQICGHKLQELSDADVLGESEPKEGRCPICNERTTIRAVLARPY